MSVGESIVADLRETFAQVAAAAPQPVMSREAAFLAIGEGIFALHARVQELTTQAQALAETMGGADLEEVLGLLNHELGLLRQGCTSEGKKGGEGLEETIRALERLQGAAAPLVRLVRSLTMLGIAVKIESARMGEEGRGFAALASDVEGLARRIPEQAATITTEVLAMAAELRAQAKQIEQRRQHEEALVARVLDRLGHELAILGDLSRRSHALGVAIQQAAAAASGHMNALVAGVQIHDMLRQRLEHVAEALTEALRMAAITPPDPLAMVASVVDIAELQRRQLAACGVDLSQGVEGMLAHIAGLGHQAETLARQAVLALEGEGASVLAAVHQELAPLSAYVKSAADEEMTMAKALAEAQQRVVGLGRLVEGIENIGIEIEIVALNASIRAARAGAAGRCLGVIAGAIQEMSTQARRQTQGLAATLEGILEAAGQLTETQTTSAVGTAVERFAEFLARLEAMAEATGRQQAALAEIARAVGQESARLQAVVQGQLPAAAEIQRLAERLETAIAPWLGHPDVALSPRSEVLADLAHRYTMERERAIHAGTTPASEDLGDNIELF